MLSLSCTEGLGEWYLRNTFPDTMRFRTEKWDRLIREIWMPVFVYSCITGLITPDCIQGRQMCTFHMPGEIRASKRVCKPRMATPQWQPELLAVLAFSSPVGWNFESSPCFSSGIAPLLAFLRSFGALSSHFYCPFFCRYVEFRPFKKTSGKCQKLSKGKT